MRRLLAAASLALLLPAMPAVSALVVLTEGRHLKAASFHLEGEERIRIVLVGGGEVVLPIERVERIVDDELEPPAAVEEPVAPATKAWPSVRRPSGRPHSAPARWARLVEEAAEAHQVDPALVAAVIHVESSWKPRAVSPKGARGLMQLMPATARRLGVSRSFDPAQNVGGGARYLSLLAKRFGENEPEKILAAYNAGEGAVEAYGGIPPYRETRAYVRKVIALWTGEPAGS
ncbi:MAG TPA: lytic transglycosylase domain-containing protein [Thermoanaerobaculia bacterium]|nr:lytic transglycosylase domain-containing protein [Thermoanaerobaculia bacterium]HQN06571.1 lytic transglycosylase domain-containing protein [Thermoanaerobaculia bacterium]HQP85740.1 lytic transglycosylase domain-containing protein [Thermoanaerobaculia bacterium]